MDTQLSLCSYICWVVALISVYCVQPNPNPSPNIIHFFALLKPVFGPQEQTWSLALSQKCLMTTLPTSSGQLFITWRYIETDSEKLVHAYTSSRFAYYSAIFFRIIRTVSRKSQAHSVCSQIAHMYTKIFTYYASTELTSLASGSI